MFKKIIALAAIATICAGYAYATTYGDITSLNSFVFRPSNNVQVYYGTETGIDATKTPQMYTIASKHTSGNRIYSTSNGASNIYYKEVDTEVYIGKALSTLTTAIDVNAGDSVYPTSGSPAWQAM